MGGSGMFTYFVLLIAIFYFMLYRPQQKQRRQREELIASLEVGKKVVTIGGIHGEVKNIADESITLEIAEGVEVDFQKTAIAFLKKDPDLTVADEDNDDEDSEAGETRLEKPAENGNEGLDNTGLDEEPVLMDEPLNEDTSGKV